MKRSQVNRKDDSKTRSMRIHRKILRMRRENTYTLIGYKGSILRARLIVRDGGLLVMRTVR